MENLPGPLDEKSISNLQTKGFCARQNKNYEKLQTLTNVVKLSNINTCRDNRSCSVVMPMVCLFNFASSLGWGQGTDCLRGYLVRLGSPRMWTKSLGPSNDTLALYLPKCSENCSSASNYLEMVLKHIKTIETPFQQPKAPRPRLPIASQLFPKQSGPSPSMPLKGSATSKWRLNGTRKRKQRSSEGNWIKLKRCPSLISTSEPFGITSRRQPWHSRDWKWWDGGNNGNL